MKSYSDSQKGSKWLDFPLAMNLHNRLILIIVFYFQLKSRLLAKDTKRDFDETLLLSVPRPATGSGQCLLEVPDVAREMRSPREVDFP